MLYTMYGIYAGKAAEAQEACLLAVQPPKRVRKRFNIEEDAWRCP